MRSNEGSAAVIAVLVISAILGIAVYTGVENARKSGDEERRPFFSVFYDRQFHEPRDDGASGFQLRQWGDTQVSGGSQDNSLTLRRGSGSVGQGDSGLGSGSSPGVLPEIKDRDIPEGFQRGDLSPFFGQVVISSVERPRNEYDRTGVVLQSAYALGGPLDVSDWRIDTNARGSGVKIPGAISNYAPGSGGERGILMDAGDRVFLYGHYRFGDYDHPFGKNIRLNQCTGYLNAIYEFDPILPNKCPRVERDQLTSFSGACQSFLLSLPRCAVPTDQDIAQFGSDSACQSFMRNKFGYSLCYDTHKNDSEFLSDDWYVWLEGQRIPLSTDNDRVLLYDANNLLVDEFVY